MAETISGCVFRRKSSWEERAIRRVLLALEQTSKRPWRKMKSIWSSLLVFILFSGTHSSVAQAQQNKKPFTVADEIGLTLFGSAEGGAPELQFSPDGNYFAVWAERGRLDLNLVEDVLRFYRVREIEDFLEHPEILQSPSPAWAVTRSAEEGRVIDDWHWTADSRGVAFREPASNKGRRVMLADLHKKRVLTLLPKTELVRTFDIRDSQHYVYTAADPDKLHAEQVRFEAERKAPAIVGTGREIKELIFAANPLSSGTSFTTSPLWAVVDGKRFQVKRDRVPIILDGDLSLSPDGESLITDLLVPEVPPSWEILYPPPFASDPVRIHAGRQDRSSGESYVRQYVLVNLKTGSMQPLTDAPVSNAAGWFAFAHPTWSNDGKRILLPGTFVKANENSPSRPCVAVVDLSSNTSSCVEMLKGKTGPGADDVEPDYHLIVDGRFEKGDGQSVVLVFEKHQTELSESIEYRQTVGGRWQIVEHSEHKVEVTVKQNFNEPPLLVAKSNGSSRVIWNPNPQIKNFDLGEARIYSWKDKDGQSRKAGLYMPVDYKPGQRYPLVIQTHGFTDAEFRPSGVYPTAFAARALAAAGIMVLQVQEVGNCSEVTPDEGPCNASGYAVAVKQLEADGLVHPSKVGIIGFSRTCFHVMELLTAGSLHLKAASITDGVMGNYLQYMTFVDFLRNALAHEYDRMMGAQPFGEGLQQWVKRSPGFNLDKVTAPLLIVGRGPLSLLGMWEPYAGLRYLHKPVDLIMLNTDQHVLTNPAVRLASQGGSVDWFRFWLQDYEDPDPAKAEQYKRWRELRNNAAKVESKLT